MSGEHHHGHAHVHGGSSSLGAKPDPVARKRALAWSLSANTLLVVGQSVGAITFGSLALLADTVHQLSDVVALVVALVALRLSQRPHTDSYTYGLRRTEVLGALCNGVLLIAAGLWVAIEAVRRFGVERDIDGGGVLALALLGLVVNGLSALWLHRVTGANLNLRAATVHLLADAAGSALVLVSAVAVLAWDATWTDPVLSLVISGLVMAHGIQILSATTSIFLEGAPSNIELDDIRSVFGSEPSVLDYHHLHVWSLDSETTALTVHVVVEEKDLHEAQGLATRLETHLATLGIDHTTLALECHDCTDLAGAEPTC